MDLKDFAIDPARLEEGAWISNIPDAGELRLHVRGLGNSDFRALQAKLFEGVPRSKRVGGRIAPEEQERILVTCLLDTVLLGWDGLESGGQPFSYSKENARLLLTDARYRRFRDAVTWAAGVVAEDGAAALADDVGNSSTA